MWLTCSSIGRKFVMAITGACLVLFVTFHVLMNSVALLWPEAYNTICKLLGANWYALVASLGLAALFIIHFIYAAWLTIQNRKARGTDRYEVESRPAQVEWSSKNMFVLGIVVVAFLAVHLMQFWYKMQFQELMGTQVEVNGATAAPEFGTLFLQAAFSEIWTPIVYVIGFIALWFHMNHGFWSMFHTVGWDNNVWISRLKSIACWWSSIVVLLFIAQAVLFTIQAKNEFFLKDAALQEQYAEYWAEKSETAIADFQVALQAKQSELYKQEGMDQYRMQNAMEEFFKTEGTKLYYTLEGVNKAARVQCPDVANASLMQSQQAADNLAAQLNIMPTELIEAAPSVQAEEEVVEAEPVSTDSIK